MTSAVRRMYDTDVISRAALPVLCLLAACATSPDGPGNGGADFSYLESADAAIVTRNAIRLRIEADASFRATSVSNRVAHFGGHPYEVSLAALLGGSEAVMVHGERVADSSGASDYANLPLADWPDGRFRTRVMCAAIDAATVAEEHDLSFLARHGWNPEGSLAIAQYLATTEDHNQEVVISLLVRGVDCADAAAREAALRRLRDKVRVMPG